MTCGPHLVRLPSIHPPIPSPTPVQRHSVLPSRKKHPLPSFLSPTLLHPPPHLLAPPYSSLLEAREGGDGGRAACMAAAEGISLARPERFKQGEITIDLIGDGRSPTDTRLDLTPLPHQTQPTKPLGRPPHPSHSLPPRRLPSRVARVISRYSKS